MNWSLVAAFLPSVITVLAVVHWSGEQKANMRAMKETQTQHTDRLDDHEGKLTAHAEELAESRGWRKGFDAARGQAPKV